MQVPNDDSGEASMTKKLVLIHTAGSLVEKFTELCQAAVPDAEVVHIVDESLIKDTIAVGKLTEATSRRLAEHILDAEKAGADTIMVTCSSIGPAVEAARPLVHVSLLRVDQPMADYAVSMARRIGIIATLSTTLAPTTQLVQARADAQGRTVELITYLCEGAFEALMAGDLATHDAQVKAGLAELAQKVDVIILAQVSMARVADALPDHEKVVPILSSPQSGVDAARQALAQS
jgi:Asp/Glu/hydantoin racemase